MKKRISEVSKLAGVSKRTLQYYDDEGVLVAERSENNHRLYDEEMLEQIWRIIVYKGLGFELKEIRQLLQGSREEQKEYLGLRIENIRSEIQQLNEQLELISFVLKHGMPRVPEEGEGKTYVEEMDEWKRKIFSSLI